MGGEGADKEEKEMPVDLECSPSVLITNLARVKPFHKTSQAPPKKKKRKKKTSAGWQQDEEIRGNAVARKFHLRFDKT